MAGGMPVKAGTRAYWRTWWLAVACAAALCAPASAADQPATWFVRSGGQEDGRGTRGAPFGSLARVEAASHSGDRIVVLPAPSSEGPLDGGLRLKPRQRLVGSAAGSRNRAPRLTNTTAHLEGDAVRLADNTTVRNMEIAGQRARVREHG